MFIILGPGLVVEYKVLLRRKLLQNSLTFVNRLLPCMVLNLNNISDESYFYYMFKGSLGP